MAHEVGAGTPMMDGGVTGGEDEDMPQAAAAEPGPYIWDLDLSYPLKRVYAVDAAELDSQTTTAPLSKESRADVLASSNFTKGVKWSPDGLCLLSNSEDNFIRLFELPPTSMEELCASESDPCAMLQPCLRFKGGETTYDYAWYPSMNSQDPSSCVFASTSRDHPLHLWDAFTGKVRCSYLAYDDKDEIEAALCVAFSADGTKLMSGYKRCVRVFDIARPGRVCEERKTWTKRHGGQNGMISCIAMCERFPGFYATGSYSRTVGLFMEGSGTVVDVLHGHTGGVTQIQFSPDGNYLFSGARKDNEILCWDIRSTGAVLARVPRVVNTNQRVQFDVHPSGKVLMTPSQDGRVLFYDLQSMHDGIVKRTEIAREGTSVDPADLIQTPSQTASVPTINAASFHPYWPLIATGTGRRRFTSHDDSVMEEAPVTPSVDVWQSGWHVPSG